MKTKKWQDYFYSEAQLACAGIAVRDDDGTEFMGSAAYLAPGLFITAKHVIEHPMNKVGITKTIYENKKFGQKDGSYDTDKFRIDAVQLLRLEEKHAQRWPLQKMRYSHDYDLAIVTANGTEGPISHLIDSLPVISINIHPMPFKSDVISYGFFGKSHHTNDEKGTDNHDLTFEGRRGNLVNFHLDTASVAGSAVYEVDNKIEHMMSGGPTFNHEGSIMGINSTGLDPDEDNPSNRTIVTPLIRAMYMVFSYWENGSWVKTTLHQLANRGVIEVIGYEHLSLKEDKIVWTPKTNCDYCKRGLEFHKTQS